MKINKKFLASTCEFADFYGEKLIDDSVQSTVEYVLKNPSYEMILEKIIYNEPDSHFSKQDPDAEYPAHDVYDIHTKDGFAYIKVFTDGSWALSFD